MSGELHLELSTLTGYRDIWKFRVKDTSIATVRMKDFTTAHAQQIFESLVVIPKSSSGEGFVVRCVQSSPTNQCDHWNQPPSDFMFLAEKQGFVLNLDNLNNRPDTQRRLAWMDGNHFDAALPLILSSDGWQNRADDSAAC
ncbi:MAG: hypothetical protein WB630_05965 [Candidatus Acidiferrales bacterium]